MILVQAPRNEKLLEFAMGWFPLVRERGGWQNVYQTFGALDSGHTPRAALIISDYNEHEADLNLVAQRAGAITPNMARYVFRWTFAQGFKRLNAKVAKRNKRSRKMTEGMGFRLEGTLKYGYGRGEDDLCIYGMTYDNCKWINYGKFAKTARPLSNGASAGSGQPLGS